jgi:hypothetical protein
MTRETAHGEPARPAWVEDAAGSSGVRFAGETTLETLPPCGYRSQILAIS